MRQDLIALNSDSTNDIAGHNGQSAQTGGKGGSGGAPSLCGLVIVQEGEDGEEITLTLGDEQAVADLLANRLLPADDVLQVRPSSTDTYQLRLRWEQPSPPAKILVVDDDKGTRDVFNAMLTEMGYHVEVATDAADGLAKAKLEPFDVALIDVRLPDVNGYQLAQAFLREDIFEGKTLLMSADPTAADLDKIKGVGAVGFIENPILPSQLEERISGLQPLDQVGPKATEIKTIDQSQRTIDIRLLGRPSLVLDGVTHILPAGRSTVLVAALAANCPAPVAAAQLGRFGWGTDGDNTSAIYTAVSRLRTFFSSIGADGLIQRDASGYRLELDASNVDVVRFETLAQRALSAPDSSARDYEAVLSIWAGRPFGGQETASLSRWSARLNETRAQLLEAQSGAYLRAKDWAACINVCTGLLDETPWREGVWATLIAALYQSGRTREALETLRKAGDLLRTKLGLDPGPALQQMEFMVLTHDVRLLTWSPGETIGLPRTD